MIYHERLECVQADLASTRKAFKAKNSILALEVVELIIARILVSDFLLDISIAWLTLREGALSRNVEVIETLIDLTCLAILSFSHLHRDFHPREVF